MSKDKKKEKKPVRMTNREFAKADKQFIEACKDVTEPTARQASKFRRGMGLAFQATRGVKS